MIWQGQLVNQTFSQSCLKLLQSQVSKENVKNFYILSIWNVWSEVGNNLPVAPQIAVLSDMFGIYSKILWIQRNSIFQ